MIGHIETACFHYSGGCEMIFASNREAEWIRTTPDIRECYGKLFDKESGSSVVMLSPAKNGIILTISKMIPNRYGDNLTAYLYIPNALDISGEALQGIVFDVISSLAHNRRDAVGSCLSSISNSEYEQLSPVDFEQATTNSYAYKNCQVILQLVRLHPADFIYFPLVEVDILFESFDDELCRFVGIHFRSVDAQVVA